LILAESIFELFLVVAIQRLDGSLDRGSTRRYLAAAVWKRNGGQYVVVLEKFEHNARATRNFAKYLAYIFFVEPAHFVVW